MPPTLLHDPSTRKGRHAGSPTCQPIATAIATLEAQRDALRATLPALAPLDRWTALAQVGDLGRQITEQQRQLDECQRQHAAAYEAEVVVLDTTGGAAAARTAKLWRLDGDAPALLETAAVQPSGVVFAARVEGIASVGVTIEETGNPAVQGPDFRSGALPELPRKAPGDPSGRVEIVVAPPLAFSAADVDAWIRAVALPAQTSTSLPGSIPGDVGVTVSALSISLGSGSLVVAVSGTATVTGALWGAQRVPFTLQVPLAFALPSTPEVDRVCDVLIAGSPTISMGGPTGAMLTPLISFFATFVGAQALPAMREAANRAIPPAVASALGLGRVPAGVRVSLRDVSITPTALTVTPALGAFGDRLTTFQP